MEKLLNALIFLRKVLKLYINKLKVIVDKDSWYPWALERIGLEYEHQHLEYVTE